MKERTWKQQRCSSADEWVTVVHSDKETVFGSLKRNEPLIQEKTWEKLKCILLNEKKVILKRWHTDDWSLGHWEIHRQEKDSMVGSDGE